MGRERNCTRKVYSELLTSEEREELKKIDSYWENLAIHHLFKKTIPEELVREFYVFNWESATPNFEKLFQLGLKGIIWEVEERKQRLEKEWLEADNYDITQIIMQHIEKWQGG